MNPSSRSDKQAVVVPQLLVFGQQTGQEQDHQEKENLGDRGLNPELVVRQGRNQQDLEDMQPGGEPDCAGQGDAADPADLAAGTSGSAADSGDGRKSSSGSGTLYS